MLAPNFRSAEELGLTPSQRDALIKVLGMLERGELEEVHHNDNTDKRAWPDNAFTMRSWQTCICGHAMRFAEWPDSARSQEGPTGSLFYRTGMNMDQATMALRDYLCGWNPVPPPSAPPASFEPSIYANTDEPL